MRLGMFAVVIACVAGGAAACSSASSAPDVKGAVEEGDAGGVVAVDAGAASDAGAEVADSARPGDDAQADAGEVTDAAPAIDSATCAVTSIPAGWTESPATPPPGVVLANPADCVATDTKDGGWVCPACLPFVYLCDSTSQVYPHELVEAGATIVALERQAGSYYSCSDVALCMRNTTNDKDCPSTQPSAYECAPLLDGGFPPAPSAGCVTGGVGAPGYCCPAPDAG